jgi:type IV fimbrial biogenesis protein FimT
MVRRVLSIAVCSRGCAGFSLIELLVVMVIAGILLAIGVPNMQSYFVTTRMNSASSEFVGILNLARSEAVKRGARVVIARTGATSRNWGEGWQAFVDLDGNNVRDTSSTSQETLLRESSPLPGAMTLYSNGTAADRIVFDGVGRTAATGTALFVHCYDGSNITVDGERRARAVIVAPSGRIRSSDYNTSQQPLNESGAAITSCTNPS